MTIIFLFISALTVVSNGITSVVFVPGFALIFLPRSATSRLASLVHLHTTFQRSKATGISFFDRQQRSKQ
jgi:hypothetical protein